MDFSRPRTCPALFWISLFSGMLFLCVRSAAILSGSSNYCQWETVNITCAAHEVIVMESARYGRMAVGRCVSPEYGYVGCLADVLDVLDAHCSGRRHCTFPVNTFVTLNARPCPKDVTSYLEVSHRCIPVSQATLSQCVSARALPLTSPSGYIASTASWDHNLGTQRCPWVIKAQPGQRVNVSLVDFGVYEGTSGGTGTGSSGGGGYCPRHLYAELRDDVTGRTTRVCGGTSMKQRERSVYVSKGDSVTVTLRRTDPQTGPTFLLRYTAFGCPDLKADPGTSVVMGTGNSARVTCDATGESWTRMCRGNSWSGAGRNCTSPAAGDGGSWSSVFGEDWTSSNGILMVIALGVGLGIVIGVCLLGVSLVILKRRGWQFGCGKQDGALGDLSSIKLHSGPPVYDYTGGVGAAAPHKGGGAGGGGTQHPHSQHTYSSGYGSDALLMDTTHPLDLRYTGHYGDLQHVTSGLAGSTWGGAAPPPGAGVHNYNRSLSRTSQSSLGHIYESPDFLTSGGGGGGGCGAGAPPREII